jgi:hypothetical protein
VNLRHGTTVDVHYDSTLVPQSLIYRLLLLLLEPALILLCMYIKLSVGSRSALLPKVPNQILTVRPISVIAVPYEGSIWDTLMPFAKIHH